MGDFFKGLGATIVVILCMALLGFSLTYFLLPGYYNAQNRAFHASQPYNDGQSVNLALYKTNYYACDSQSCRDAIRSTVIEQYANYPEDRLTPDLRDFLDKMKG